MQGVFCWRENTDHHASIKARMRNKNRTEVIIVVGKRLKDLRRAKNVRQEDLATILGVQKAVISHYETDKVDPSDKVKVEIAKFFDNIIDGVI